LVAYPDSQDQLQPSVFDSLDAKEGATAFVERRAPVWQGRVIPRVEPQDCGGE
jgi:hypothetical protein